jgi:hypothetical protein
MPRTIVSIMGRLSRKYNSSRIKEKRVRRERGEGEYLERGQVVWR